MEQLIFGCSRSVGCHWVPGAILPIGCFPLGLLNAEGKGQEKLIHPRVPARVPAKIPNQVTLFLSAGVGAQSSKDYMLLVLVAIPP